MTPNRDDLAKLIFITDNSPSPDPEAEWNRAVEGLGWKCAEYAYVIADGLIAAGYKRGGGTI